ncbi:MAG: hypothetical protein QG567_666 [Campylobacterota bacterium]|nr:hypothetical protein [Campylobacterota bacterium]
MYSSLGYQIPNRGGKYTKVFTMSKIEKRWMRAKEVSQYLSIGLSTVWLYASQGRLTAKKLSSRVTVFDIEEVERLLDGQMKSTEKNGSTQP